MTAVAPEAGVAPELSRRRRAKRRFLVPEVIQTSAMDCGPAALKALLEGFGIPVSYGRLREACQTSVDGTSIDVLDDVAMQLGLDVEQVVVPFDSVFADPKAVLPAILVVTQPSGVNHFVVVWSTHGGYVQVMDPGAGRQWLRPGQILRQSFQHTQAFDPDDWFAWASGDYFVVPFRARMKKLGLDADKLLRDAFASPDWRQLALLDATVRMATVLFVAGALSAGRRATRFVQDTLSRGFAEGYRQDGLIPPYFWAVRDDDERVREALGREGVMMTGAVLLRARGLRGAHVAGTADDDGPRVPLSQETIAAMHETSVAPLVELFRLLRADGALSLGVLAPSLIVLTLATALEALLLRGAVDLGRELNLVHQRLMALGALLLFGGLLLLFEGSASGVLQRAGRHVEARFRLALLRKIPLLGDHYFRSRLTSDMAERAYSIATVRAFPGFGRRVVQAVLDLLVTTTALYFVDPKSVYFALAATAFAIIMPMLVRAAQIELDMRTRSHNGALARFYLDSLLGLIPVRTHGAERAVRREHESLLVEWVRAALDSLRLQVVLGAVESVFGIGLVVGLVARYVTTTGEPQGILLLIYWGLRLPELAQTVVDVMSQLPGYRNAVARLVEPLGAPEEGAVERLEDDDEAAVAARSRARARGVRLDLRAVTVHAGGHTILEDVTLSVRPGSHIAIVGRSGAGKSSLVGTLLGWHAPVSGEVLVDGVPLNASSLGYVRAQTAWVDPAVQLWNRTLLDNVRYGVPAQGGSPFARVIAQADLLTVLEKLPEGMQTPLGEGGALVSGGEGQRVRLARAMMRDEARLVLLDEPFRGLDRHKRREMLARARELWKDATLICVTHDVSETIDFGRVLVVDGGRIVEDGAPAELDRDPESIYGVLRAADEGVRRKVWSESLWRRLRVQGGRVVETDGRGQGPK